jgi:hypothetical protein
MPNVDVIHVAKRDVMLQFRYKPIDRQSGIPTHLIGRGLQVAAMLCALAAGMSLSSSAVANPAFKTFTVAGSFETIPDCIANGVIGGHYENTDLKPRGVVRASNGTITKFDPAGSESTFPIGSNGLFHGFTRTASGTISSFDPAGSIATYGGSINDKGAIAGSFEDSSNLVHGYVRAAGGTIATFDPAGSADTSAASIDEEGQIAGWYYDDSRVIHGFLRQEKGKVAEFEVPGSSYAAGMSIDSSRGDKGAVTGYYTNPSQGFLRIP